MVNQSLINIQEVSSSGGSGTTRAAVSENAQVPSYADMPLDQIRAQSGNFFVPSYLPSGFALAKSVSVEGGDISIGYRRSDARVSISTFQGTRSFQPHVKSGSVSNIMVNGSPAYLIRGGWVHHITPSGQVRPATWSEDIALGIVFQRGDRWIEVRSAPYPARNGLTENDLLRVANSVEVYVPVTGTGPGPGSGEEHGGVSAIE